MSDDEDGSAGKGTPLARAAERIRASSQWLLGAFAAVGAVLAGGLQIADIGELTVDNLPRLILAIGGILVAVVGIISAIASAATVSTKSDVSLQWLRANPKSSAARAIAEDASLTQGETAESLEVHLIAAVTAARATYDEILALGDPGDEPSRKAQAEGLNGRYKIETARLADLKAVRADVLDVASFIRVKSAYQDAKSGVLAGALMAAVGITMFAWGANAPDISEVDGGEVLPKTPSSVTVILSDDGTERFVDALGPSCASSNVAAIALEVDKTTYTVVSVRTEDCAVVTMQISEDLGIVIPRGNAEVANNGDDGTSE